MAALRNVTSLILAVALLQIAGGLLGVLVPLGLGALNVSDLIVGIIAAIFSAGFMLGAYLSPQWLSQFGNIRVFSAAAGACGATVLLMALWRDPIAWAFIRLIHGAAFAAMFASAESWMTEATPDDRRGSVLGIYHVAAKLALLLGPYLAIGYETTTAEPFLWCGVFLSLALIPVCITRKLQPEAPDNSPYGLKDMIKVAPSAVTASFIAGVSNTGFLSMLPLYAREGDGGESAVTAANLMAAAWLGGLISQWPAGLISDKLDRRLVIAGLALLSAVTSAALVLLPSNPTSNVTLILIGLWGAGSLSFYGISVAHAADRSETENLAKMLSGLLFVWAAGSVLGPAIFGLIMSSAFGIKGLFLLEAILSGALVFFMLYRRGAQAPVKLADREAFESAQPTSLTAMESDPRTEGDASPA